MNMTELGVRTLLGEHEYQVKYRSENYDTREHLKVTKDLLNRVEALEKVSTKNEKQIQETEQVQEEIKEQPVQKKR